MTTRLCYTPGALVLSTTSSGCNPPGNRSRSERTPHLVEPRSIVGRIAASAGRNLLHQRRARLCLTPDTLVLDTARTSWKTLHQHRQPNSVAHLMLSSSTPPALSFLALSALTAIRSVIDPCPFILCIRLDRGQLPPGLQPVSAGICFASATGWRRWRSNFQPTPTGNSLINTVVDDTSEANFRSIPVEIWATVGRTPILTWTQSDSDLIATEIQSNRDCQWPHYWQS